jgi:hypothetical protein
MKNIFFYVLFLICISAFFLGVYVIFEGGDAVIAGIGLLVTSIFFSFILWKNNFFTKSKS